MILFQFLHGARHILWTTRIERR